VSAVATSAALASKASVYERAAHLIRRDLTECAPRFALAVQFGIAECQRRGFDAVVNEAVRTDELQRLYYTLGRTVPNSSVVTYAKSALYSWHGYGLAIDVRSKSKGYGVPTSWWRDVANVMKAAGLDWGGEWTRPDLPHFQWGTLRPAPSDVARELYRTGGLHAVWRAVGADL
jgi:hypothetical protein